MGTADVGDRDAAAMSRRVGRVAIVMSMSMPEKMMAANAARLV